MIDSDRFIYFTSLGNAGFTTLAAISWDITATEFFAIIFVTVPVGILSWWKVVDEVRKRRGRKEDE